MKTTQIFNTRYKNISMIDVPERQRRSFNPIALDELKSDIAENGLLHAIVLRDDNKLVAGERRLRAMTQLHADKIDFTYNREIVPENCVPFIDISARDEIQALQMELNENLLREDLTWQDKVRAQNELQKLRTAQNSEQTFKKTAEEIVARTGSGNAKTIQEEISRSMVTADFLDHPEVRNAKNERWAFNAAAKILRDEFANKLGKNVQSRHRFLAGNAEDMIPLLYKEEKQFNCFIIDPPYGIDAHTFHPGNSPADKIHEYRDDIESALEFSRFLIKACSGLATPDAHLWMFCDVELFLKLREDCQNYGWTVFRTPLIWNKGSTGYILRKSNIRRGFEMLLFAQRSDARGLSQVLQDVISISSREEDKLHAAQKPTSLYELLIRMSCLPNDNVLDPCCGSGTIFRASQSVKVSATGIERDEEFIKICQNLLIELETC